MNFKEYINSLRKNREEILSQQNGKQRAEKMLMDLIETKRLVLESIGCVTILITGDKVRNVFAASVFFDEIGEENGLTIQIKDVVLPFDDEVIAQMKITISTICHSNHSN